MKNLFIPFVALFLVVSLGSCDKVADLADIDIPLEVTSDPIDLNGVPAAGKAQFSYDFDETVDVDLFQGELKDYKEYLDKIKHFKVTKLIVTVVKIEEGKDIKFVDPTKAILKDASSKVEIDLSGYDVQVNSSYEVTGTVLKEIDKILNKKKSFKYQVVGGFNQDAHITIRIEIAGKVTVNPFK